MKDGCSSPDTFWSPVCSGQVSSTPLNDTPAHPLTRRDAGLSEADLCPGEP